MSLLPLVSLRKIQIVISNINGFVVKVESKTNCLFGAGRLN
jgi:hypothetical protein